MSLMRSSAWILAAVATVALADEPALTASQVVERNAVARGGVEAWRKVESMAWSGRVETSPSGRRATFLLEQKRPGRTRFEVTVEGQKALRVFDGTDGWKVRPSSSGRPEVQPYTPEELKFARGASVIEGPLMDLVSKGASVALVGVEVVGGRRAHVLELRLPSGGASRAWIDAETFLELRHDREVVSAQGRPRVTSVYFADYRAAEGLQLPFAIETGTPDGTARDKLVIQRVAVNPPLDDRTFAKPGSPVARRRGATVDTRSAARLKPAPPPQ